MIGIVIALILRAVLIAVGAAAIEAFSGVFYLFGAFLLFTAVQLIRHRDQEPEPGNNKVLTARRAGAAHDHRSTTARS